MSVTHLIPEKVRIINDATKYPVTYTGRAAATATDAIIKGFAGGLGKVKIASLNSIIIKRGLEAVKPVYQLNEATAAEITVGGSIPDGTKATFLITVEDTKRDLRYAQNSSYEYRKTYPYEVTLNTGDTAGNVLFKLYTAINKGDRRNYDKPLVASVGTGGTLGADTLDLLDVTVQEEGKFINEKAKWTKVVGEDASASSYVTVFKFDNIGQFTRGIGRGFDLEFAEKMQVNNLDQYGFDVGEVPLEGKLYTAVYWDFTVSRTHPYAVDKAPISRNLMYIEESNSAYIDELIDFLTINVSTRATSLAADGLIAGFNDAEVVTNSAGVSSASNANSAHMTLTPLYGALAGTDAKYVEVQSVALDDTIDTFLTPKLKTNA